MTEFIKKEDALTIEHEKVSELTQWIRDNPNIKVISIERKSHLFKFATYITYYEE